MADEPSKPTGSDGDAEMKKAATIVGIMGGVFGVLIAVYTLTGFNPLKEILPKSTPTTPTATKLTLTTEPTWTFPPTTTFTPPPIVTTTTTFTPPPATTTTKPAWMLQTNFYVQSEQWTGPCGWTGCPMSANFRNVGGEGAALADFYVIPNDGAHKYVALCSAVIPSTPYNGLVNVGCGAYSNLYQQYIKLHPGVTMSMDVKVKNSVLGN
jgi:hypothetical protein